MDEMPNGLTYSMDDLAVNFTTRDWLILIAASLMIVCVIFGNVLILLAIVKHRPLQMPPIYLIASLAVSDLTVGLLAMPLSLIRELTGMLRFGSILCDFWISIDVLCCTASILNLCVIALDRYWAITKPLEYKQKRTTIRMLVMIVAVWLISTVISTTPFYGWQPDNQEAQTCIISQNRVFTILSTFGAFFVPMTIMLAVYARIFVEAHKRIHGKTKTTVQNPYDSLRLRRNTGDFTQKPSSLLQQKSFREPRIATPESPTCILKPLPKFSISQHYNSGPDKTAAPSDNVSSPNHLQPFLSSNNCLSLPNSKPSDSRRRSSSLSVPNSPYIQQRMIQRRHLASAREHKAIKTLAIVAGSFLFCWLPFFLATLMIPFCQQCNLPPVWRSLFLWLGYFNSMLNPILYTKFNKDFKDAFGKLLHCFSRKCPSCQFQNLSPKCSYQGSDCKSKMPHSLNPSSSSTNGSRAPAQENKTHTVKPILATTCP